MPSSDREILVVFDLLSDLGAVEADAADVGRTTFDLSGDSGAQESFVFDIDDVAWQTGASQPALVVLAAE